MPQSLNSIGCQDNKSSSGFALASALVIMVILAIVGAAVYGSVRTDITQAGKDLNRVRAEYAAESSVQWALAELSRTRTGMLPYALATHGPDGETKMSEMTSAGADSSGNGRTSLPMKATDLAEIPGSQVGVDADGWIYTTTTSVQNAISGGSQEMLSFKVWYPNDSTLRITGRGVVDGSKAELNLVSTLTVIATRM